MRNMAAMNDMTGSSRAKAAGRARCRRREIARAGVAREDSGARTRVDSAHKQHAAQRPEAAPLVDRELVALARCVRCVVDAVCLSAPPRAVVVRVEVDNGGRHPAADGRRGAKRCCA